MSFDDLWNRYMRGGATPDAYAARGWNMGRLLRDVRLSGQVTGEDAANIANTIAAELEARGYPMIHDVDTLTLTTAHAASSHGQPVLLIDGDPFGPMDLTPDGTPAAILVTDWAARFIRTLSPEVRALLVTDTAPLAALAPAMLDLLRQMLALYAGQRLAPPETFASYWKDVDDMIRQAEEAGR